MVGSYKGVLYGLSIEVKLKIGGCNYYGCTIMWYTGGGYKYYHWTTDPKCDKEGTLVCAEWTEHDLNCIVYTVSSRHADGECCHTTVLKGSVAGD